MLGGPSEPAALRRAQSSRTRRSIFISPGRAALWWPILCTTGGAQTGARRKSIDSREAAGANRLNFLSQAEMRAAHVTQSLSFGRRSDCLPATAASRVASADVSSSAPRLCCHELAQANELQPAAYAKCSRPLATVRAGEVCGLCASRRPIRAGAERAAQTRAEFTRRALSTFSRQPRGEKRNLEPHRRFPRAHAGSYFRYCCCCRLSSLRRRIPTITSLM